MVTYLQLKNGIGKFIDYELLNKITGWQKWMVGAGLSMFMEDGINVFNSMKNHPLIQQLGIIDADDMIDLDRIYKHLVEEARKQAVTFKAPLVGDITLKADDVEKLYKYIQEQ